MKAVAMIISGLRRPKDKSASRSVEPVKKEASGFTRSSKQQGTTAEWSTPRRVLYSAALQPSGKTKVLYDFAVQKLLDEEGLSLLDASTSNKSEWHNNFNQTRACGIQVSGPSCPLLSPRGLHHPHPMSHEQLAPR
jgi:hypothetical protein